MSRESLLVRFVEQSPHDSDSRENADDDTAEEETELQYAPRVGNQTPSRPARTLPTATPIDVVPTARTSAWGRKRSEYRNVE
ncbi:hypothetical protein [Haloprofundus halobius]|uniref:hypothetical protein n=1 Tax=Haloprofundus halobius TaxID=2876194 RepID=UPI001CCDADF3|nr:hypothetical protein [Haloprofundus halobius]